MRKAYDLCVKVRSYTDKNGNNKNSYKNIGSFMVNEQNEPFILLDPYYNYAAFPRNENSDSLTVSMFKSDRNNNQQQQQQPQQRQNNYAPQWNGESFNQTQTQQFNNNREISQEIDMPF